MIWRWVALCWAGWAMSRAAKRAMKAGESAKACRILKQCATMWFVERIGIGFRRFEPFYKSIRKLREVYRRAGVEADVSQLEQLGTEWDELVKGDKWKTSEGRRIAEEIKAKFQRVIASLPDARSTR